ncbi:Cyclic nucleotide-gated cation channel alpha-4 [Araneus ventricosus]|uniref:Cyclic nucleotide-gated cation channel alpha-4 n=1 Tax=Araneus ventricosus TaxID=182803 RepID=A0A4Y2BV37_ARAVE|nr:Cyclic nucleotide-gated cation channel alpha-4 [Araneus ventricosus]
MEEGAKPPRAINLRLSVTNGKRSLEALWNTPWFTDLESLHKTESDPSSPGGSRWKKLRTTVQLSNAVSHHRKPPLKREDSFLKRFSTRPPNVILSDKDPIKADNWFYRVASASVLNPDESLLFWWLWMVTFCGLYNSWTLIAREAFPELQEAHVVLWDVLDWCSDVVYLLDIAVQFRTGYLEQGIMVRDSAQLAKHYVKSRDFILDVAALAPLSFLHGILGESPLLRFPR